MSLGLAVSHVGSVHVVVVVVGMREAVVQEQGRVRLHVGVHVIHQLLQVHIVVCEQRWTDVKRPLGVTSARSS